LFRDPESNINNVHVVYNFGCMELLHDWKVICGGGLEKRISGI
jgi:hypothetical protein